MRTLKLKDDIYWLGSLDSDLRVFDIIMETEFGTTYNSYLVKGSEKVALFETVKEKCFDDYIEKVKSLTDLDKIDYIVVSHTEPDHAGSIVKMIELLPHITIVGSDRAIEFLKDITNTEFKYIAVGSGDTLSLGNKTLEFYSVPFLHWPDTIYTYIKEDKTLVTCDSFGSHYSFEGVLLSSIPAEKMNDYYKALKYYWTAIFSPFRPYVIEALDKIAPIYDDIDLILPGHGPVLDKDVKEVMETYRKWSTPLAKPTNTRIVMPYCAAYGYTEKLAFEIEKGIHAYNPEIEVIKYNLDVGNFGALKFEVIREMGYASGILLGTSTINGDALPLISDLAQSMDPISYAGKYASAFGSYGWSGEGVDNIMARLDQLRMKVLDGYKIKFKPDEAKLNGAFEFGYNFAKHMVEKLEPVRVIYRREDTETMEGFDHWKCTVCGEVYPGANPPHVCPACGVGVEYFVGFDLEEVILADSHEKFLIIGGGIAGLTAASTIRSSAPSARIEIIESEKTLPYYRTMLSEYLYRTMGDTELYLKPLSWFTENNIDLNIGTPVKHVDFDGKKVVMADGEERLFDKIILANGARCNKPPISNSNIPGVYTMRSKHDADEIIKHAKDAKKVVLIGGGVLGLEAAHGMKALGLDVTIVEVMQRILPRALDENGSELLEEIVANYGVTFYKNSIVAGIIGEDKVRAVHLDKDRVVEADLVIINAGVLPNKELYNESRLELNRGVIVNSKMETSIKDVYAAGDIAEFNGRVYGLWEVAIEQGKVAAKNALGIEAEYVELPQPLIFEGMGTKLISIGNITECTGIGESLEESDCEALNYKKLYFKHGKVDGGILIGDTSKGAALIKAVRKGLSKSELIRKIYS